MSERIREIASPTPLRFGFAYKVVLSDIPRLFKAGCPSDQIVRTRGWGGYLGTAKRAFLLKLLTAPSAPAKEREYYLIAQPPRLEKAGNVPEVDFMYKAPRF